MFADHVAGVHNVGSSFAKSLRLQRELDRGRQARNRSRRAKRIQCWLDGRYVEVAGESDRGSPQLRADHVDLVDAARILGRRTARQHSDLRSAQRAGSSSNQQAGAGLLRQHFDVGQSGPLVVLAHKPGADFDSPEGIKAIRELTGSLYSDGVQSVRSLIAPVGGNPEASTTNLLMQNHHTTRELYLSKQPELEGQRDGDVTRLELVLGYDPFSLDAVNVLERVNGQLKKLSKDTASYWSGSEFAFAGTTAAISDLREVTTSDNRRIQSLVVLSVLIILLILLKRPAVCIYLIISVLFSYYVTMGVTQVWFQWVYGETYHGWTGKFRCFCS